MKYLFLGNEKGMFTELASWISAYTGNNEAAVHGARWTKTPIPFTDPDRLINLSNYIMHEDYGPMGITSDPERLFYLVAAPHSRGGSYQLNGRHLEWNDYFFSQTELDKHFITQKKKCPISLEWMDETQVFPDLTFLPLPIDITEIDQAEVRTDKLVIGQALSSSGLMCGVSKGFHILKKLYQELDFELDVFTGLTHEQSLTRKANCNLIWDNHHGNIGVSGLESMAQGLPVIGRFSPICIENWTRLSGEDNVTFPVITYTTEEELKGILQTYINDPTLLVAKGQQCYDWMQEYATPENIAQYWVDTIESTINN